VSFAAITVSVASQRVFIVAVISLSTQSENFWIRPRMIRNARTLGSRLNPTRGMDIGYAQRIFGTT
jgi:hypothetical protein